MIDHLLNTPGLKWIKPNEDDVKLTSLSLDERDGCPVCGKPFKANRMLSQGEHKHDQNFLNKIDADQYCIKYGTESKNSGTRVFAKIYLHNSETN